MDQHLAHGDPQADARAHAYGAQHGSFDGQHQQDLPAQHADVAQHAELLGPGQGLGGEGGGDPGKPDQDGDGLQRIGHREATIEHAQRQGPDLPGLGEAGLAGEGGRQGGAQARHHPRLRGAGGEIDGGVGAVCVSGEARVVGAGDGDSPELARIVPPDPLHHHGLPPARKRQEQAIADAPPIEPGHGLGDPDRRGARQQRMGLRHDRQGPLRMRRIDRRDRERDGRTVWIQAQQQGLAEADAGDAGHGGQPMLVGGTQAPAAEAVQAQVEVRGKHLGQPVYHRAPEARHHHRHGHHQADAGQHAAKRDRGLARGAPDPVQRQGGRG